MEAIQRQPILPSLSNLIGYALKQARKSTMKSNCLCECVCVCVCTCVRSCELSVCLPRWLHHLFQTMSTRLIYLSTGLTANTHTHAGSEAQTHTFLHTQQLLLYVISDSLDWLTCRFFYLLTVPFNQRTPVSFPRPRWECGQAVQPGWVHLNIFTLVPFDIRLNARTDQ